MIKLKYEINITYKDKLKTNHFNVKQCGVVKLSVKVPYK